MTVTYPDNNVLRLLMRWKGSVWKDIYKEYFVFITLYFSLNLPYRFLMVDEQRKVFERTVNYFHKWNQLIPIQFLIGFYVSAVFTRWWQQLNYVAWPDKFLVFVAGNIQGMDPDSVAIRKTFARYTNLLNVLVWKEISVKIKKRFPTDEHLLRAGLLNGKEMELFKGTTSDYGRWFVPVSWMVNLLARCREEQRISDLAHQKLLEELYAFRGSSGMLTVFDWINIPLVYTQVVTLATYGYFSFCLIARQALVLGEDSPDIDIVFPLFTTLEFIFYVGWMKVGESLRCPFGEDDEDFDMNYVLDRNVQVSSMLVDELHRQRPAPSTAEVFGKRLPHTQASWKVRDPVPNWRLHKFAVPEAQQTLFQEAVEELLQTRATAEVGVGTEEEMALVTCRDRFHPA